MENEKAKYVCDFFVASCVKDGGIYRYSLYEDGRVELIYKCRLDCPMYFAKQSGVLHTLLRAPFANSKLSGYIAIDSHTGEKTSAPVSTEGEVACHISVIDNGVYIANYLSGSIVKLGKKMIVNEGKSINPVRQTSPHPHSVFPSPDRKFILSADLGLDEIFVFDKELNFVSTVKAPLGVGPRHIVFSILGDYVYCVNEMGGSVSVYSFKGGNLRLLDTVSVLPCGFVGDGSGGAIRISEDGKYLYVTERKTESIVTLSVNDSDLKIISRVSSGGKEPRDFALLKGGKYALVANQYSDKVSIFEIKSDGIPIRIGDFSLFAPIAITEADNIEK